ncbi:MAG: hypothetical protein DRI36_00395 [Caldiserica bacterium]|nr:MAG: hypothetical protein DRI36_00395 [Caldisericota bacterium]
MKWLISIFCLLILRGYLFAGLDDDLIKIKSSKREERLIAAVNLGNYKDIRAKNALIEALNDKDIGVRICAINSLSKFQDKDLIEKFIEIAKNDKNFAVRRAAIQSLSWYRKKKVIDFLEGLLSEEKLKDQVLATLSRIGGERVAGILLNYGDSLDKRMEEIAIEGLERVALTGSFGKYKEKIKKFMLKKSKSSNPRIRGRAKKILEVLK